MLSVRLKVKELNPKIIGFFIVLILIWFYGWHISIENFIYDSSLYWGLGKEFTSSGKFSWLTYDQPVRGYILPLISYICMTAADLLGVGEMVLYRFVSAVFYSFFITVLIPVLYEKITSHKLKLAYILFFFVLVAYFWRGFFLYPLSDFVSLFFMLVGTYNLISYFKKKNFVHILSAGFFIALSTIARPSYQIVLIPILVIFIIHSFIIKKDNYKKSIPVALIAIILGSSLAYGPQFFINKKNYDIDSPFVQTGIAFKGSLFTQQLLWGMYIQKYETNNNLVTYPKESVFFYDQQGINLLDKENIINFKESGLQLPENFTLNQYLSLILKNPLDMVTIYFKHFFNGADLIYHSVYLNDVYKNRSIFSFFNYSIWFISFLTICSLFKIKSIIKEKYFEISLILIIILPALLSIPSAIESRFFLPLFLLNYILIAYYLLSRKKNYNDLKKYVMKLAIPYVIYMIICFTLSITTFSTLSDGHYLFHN
ncbi:hypothetical protein D3C74_179650 [compost metagenome]